MSKQLNLSNHFSYRSKVKNNFKFESFFKIKMYVNQHFTFYIQSILICSEYRIAHAGYTLNLTSTVAPYPGISMISR